MGMRIVQLHDPELGRRVGYVDGDVVYDLTAVDPENAWSSLSLIRAGRGSLAQLVTELLAEADGRSWPLTDLQVPARSRPHILAPVDAPEVWAAGVTYEMSRTARVTESQYQSFYGLVYEAQRPELFLKTSNMLRVAGPNAPIAVRTDSTWSVPEPELSLVIDREGAIIAYTLGNDVSARDIEGENPLYLPQAKIFRGCCALGPALYIPSDRADPREWVICLRIFEPHGAEVFNSNVSVGSMRRTLEDLVGYLRRDNDIVAGTVLMTGTGIVPEDGFFLRPGQIVEISMDPVGVLRNPVLLADDPAFRFGDEAPQAARP